MFNFGNIIAIVVGSVIGAYGLYYKTIIQFSNHGVLKFARYLFYVGLTVIILVPMFVFISGLTNSATYKEDAVIILGAGLNGESPTMPLYNRLVKAEEYYQKNKDVLIIVSGGQGRGETITEAESMKRFLVSKGIPNEQIIKEDKSTSTKENIIFSKRILDEKFQHNYKVAIITNTFHINRAKNLATKLQIEATTLGAPIAWYTVPVNYLRESLATLYMWVFDSLNY